MLLSALQLTSTPDVTANFAQVQELVSRAVSAGAKLVATPENTLYMGPEEGKLDLAQKIPDGPWVQHFSNLAKGHGIWLLIGSVPEICPVAGKVYNTSILFGPDGLIQGTYRKIHLFDVDVGGPVAYRESETAEPGKNPVTVCTPLGTLGLSICYDVRFPELYRALSKNGAQILCVPAAFTPETGRVHWLPLLTARAVENLCYVVAPAQVGLHHGKRATYGHTCIIDPWGKVLALSESGRPDVISARLNLAEQAATRERFPALQHRRLQ